MGSAEDPTHPSRAGSAQDRERLRRTFDSAAELYQQARPDYPSELFDMLVEATDLRSGDRLLEVGAATGKATLPLARRGFRVTMLEPGPHLAAAARRNLAKFDVEVVEARFEDWTSAGGGFDVVFAATAWHWIDPKAKYRKAWRLLRPGGHLAFWSATHVFPEDGDPFFRDIQPIYDEIGEGLPDNAVWPRPGELDDERDEVEATGLFQVMQVRQFDWERVYDAKGYIDLLDTFSGHLAMQDWQRARLYREIRKRVGDRADGLLRRHWGAVLHVARRLDAGEGPEE
ncbi:MAG: class I SAM-dependent methyltransferase [Pseudonocardiaceae bacterium]